MFWLKYTLIFEKYLIPIYIFSDFSADQKHSTEYDVHD